MSNITLALGYVLVVLHDIWRQGYDKPIVAGTLLEVARSERNALVSSQVARDATDEEIAAFRGVPMAEEGPTDATEALAALDAAQTQLAAVGAARDALQAQVETLTQANGELSKAVQELQTEVAQLQAANATQAKALETAAKKVAKAS